MGNEIKSITAAIRELASEILNEDDDEIKSENFDKLFLLTQYIEKQTNVFMWKSTETLPEERGSVFFITKSGQMFEGFLETEDVANQILSNGKIKFPKHKDGGKWYRYAYSDFLPMDCVIMWCKKPKRDVINEEILGRNK